MFCLLVKFSTNFYGKNSFGAANLLLQVLLGKSKKCQQEKKKPHTNCDNIQLKLIQKNLFALIFLDKKKKSVHLCKTKCSLDMTLADSFSCCTFISGFDISNFRPSYCNKIKKKQKTKENNELFAGVECCCRCWLSVLTKCVSY